MCRHLFRRSWIRKWQNQCGHLMTLDCFSVSFNCMLSHEDWRRVLAFFVLILHRSGTPKGLLKGRVGRTLGLMGGTVGSLWALLGRRGRHHGSQCRFGAPLGGPRCPCSAHCQKRNRTWKINFFFSMPPCFVSSAGCHCGVDLMAVPSGFIRTPGDCIKEGIGNIVFVYNGS